MLHIVPILCLIIFVLIIEYRFKKHFDEIDFQIKAIKDQIINSEYYDTKKEIH